MESTRGTEAGSYTATVGVVIVNFNGGQLVVDCLESVLCSTVPVTVALADNGSRDDSLARVRTRFGEDARLRIIENGANLGFATGSNRALQALPDDLPFILFLNPDCKIESDTLARLLPELEQRPEVGMCGCLIVNPDGSEQRGCRRNEPTPLRALATMTRMGAARRGVNLQAQPLPQQPVEVEAISGAFMLVRREALRAVGPMDEAYFLHCEDLDWCKRFRLSGWRVLFVPTVRIEHLKGGSSQQRPVRVEWHKHRGMVRYYRKFFSADHPGYLMRLIELAVWGRFVALTPWLWVRKALRP